MLIFKYKLDLQQNNIQHDQNDQDKQDKINEENELITLIINHITINPELNKIYNNLNQIPMN
jgi:hypothetical protein